MFSGKGLWTVGMQKEWLFLRSYCGFQAPKPTCWLTAPWRDPPGARLGSDALRAAGQCWWGHRGWGLGSDSLSCPTQPSGCCLWSCRAYEPSLKPAGRPRAGIPRAGLSPQPRAVGPAGPGSPGVTTYCSSKRPTKHFGTASEQHWLTLQACILNQFRSNTKEIPSQRAFYFLCLPCNPLDYLPVPGSAAGLKASSSSHTQESWFYLPFLDGPQL